MNPQLLAQLSKITAEEQRILDGEVEVEQELYSDHRAFVIDSRKFLPKGRTIRIRPNTRFIHFPKHKHNYIEMVYMCQGLTRHMINGAPLTLHTGELLVLGQNATQEIEPAGKEDIAINFIILPEFFDQTVAMLGTEGGVIRDFLTGALRSGNSPIDFLYFRIADVLPIQNLLENLVWTIMNDIPNKHETNQITMGLLFLQLMNHVDKIDSGRNSFEQEILIEVLQYIDENYRGGTLTELANVLNCEFTWLSRKIKKMTGSTYTELVQKKRLERACHLLTVTSMSVTDISLSVGYDNLSYFHRLFQKSYGMSPRRWRVQNVS